MADAQTRALARRIANLEDWRRNSKAPTLGFSTVVGGALQISDLDDLLTMIMGRQFDGTNAPAVVTGPNPPAPSQPGLTPMIGGLRVYWDGTFAGGEVAPMDFSRVTIHAAPLAGFSSFDPTNQAQIYGEFTSATGSETVIALPQEEHVVGLFAWSLAGKFSAVSVLAFGTPALVTSGDIDSAINDAIANAQSTADTALTSANGKNKVYYQAAKPTGGTYIAGDTWFDTDDGNKVYEYRTTPSPDFYAIQFGSSALANSVNDAITNAQSTADTALTSANGKNRVYYQAAKPTGGTYIAGDTWFDTDDGNKVYEYRTTPSPDFYPLQFGSSAIADASIINAKIADATIQSAKIAALDAAKITTGYLDAARLQAKTITADKIVLTGTENLIPDPNFAAAAGVGWNLLPSNATAAIQSTAGRDGGPAWVVDHVAGVNETFYVLPNDANGGIPCEAGATYRFTMQAKSSVTGTGPAFGLRYKNTAGVWTEAYVLPPTASYTADTWTSRAATWTAPADVVAMRPFLRVVAAAGVGTYTFDEPAVVRAAAGELIVDGAVSAAKMQTGTITAASGIIADAAITNAKIANVDAAKVTTGYLDAARIQARTLTVDKLLVTGTENMIPDPGFAAPTLATTWAATGGWVVAAAGRDGGNAAQVAHTNGVSRSLYPNPSDAGGGIPVVAGGSYRINWWVKADVTGTGVVRASVRWKNTAGTWATDQLTSMSIGTANTYTLMTALWTAPSDAVAFRPGAWVNSTAPTGTYTFDEPSVVRAANSELVVDGAITGAKIAADAIDGKTITGATVQTGSSGERIVVRNDGGGGIIEFFSGVSGETGSAAINPYVAEGGTGGLSITSPASTTTPTVAELLMVPSISGSRGRIIANATLEATAIKLSGHPRVARSLSANQSVANATWTKLNLEGFTQTWPTFAWSSANDQWTNTFGKGLYRVDAQVRFDANSTGRRSVRITKNGTAFATDATLSVGGVVTDMNISTEVELDVNDTLAVEVFQTSGGALDMVSVETWVNARLATLVT